MKKIFTLLLIALSISTSVYAQEEEVVNQVPSEVAEAESTSTTADSTDSEDQSATQIFSDTVEIQSAARIETGPGTFDISFELSSPRVLGDGVRVGAAFATIDDSGTVQIAYETVLSEKVYYASPDNSPLPGMHVLSAPAYLDGTYTLMLFARTVHSGELVSIYDLGSVDLVATVPLTFNPESCLIALDQSTLLPRTSYVQVEPGATFEVRCVVQNITASPLSLVPAAIQYKYSQYGDVLENKTFDEVAVMPTEEKEIIMSLTVSDKPGTYIARISLTDTAGQVYGSTLVRYTVTGEVVGLADISLQYDDTGMVTAVASVVGTTPEVYPLTLEVQYADATASCVRTVGGSVAYGESGTLILPIAGSEACTPKVAAFILRDATGAERAVRQLTQLAAGEEIAPEVVDIPVVPETDTKGHPYRLLSIIVVLAIASIVGIAYSRRNRFANEVVGTLMLIFGLFVGATEVYAVSSGVMYYVCPTSGFCPAASNVSMGTSNPPASVLAGSSFTISVNVRSDDNPVAPHCPNVTLSTNGGSTYTPNVFGGSCYDSFGYSNGVVVSRTVTAPSTPGTYNFCARFSNGSHYTTPPPRCISYTVTGAANTAPVVNAGIDRGITLPTSMAAPSGQTATDDVGVVSRQWTFVSGPGPVPTISNGATASPTFTGMTTAGTYTFRYSATDAGGLTSSDTMLVVVSAAPTSPTTSSSANAGPDRTITLPVNDVTQSGASFYFSTPCVTSTIIRLPNTQVYDSSTPCTYGVAWSRVSGPSTPTIVGNRTLTPTFTDLVAGTYVFQMVASGGDSGSVSDRMTVTVLGTTTPPLPPPPPPNVAPNVTVVTPYTITLPTSQVITSGNSIVDSDGAVTSIVWAQTLGPVTATITNGSTANPVFSGMTTAGTYDFRVTATDDDGATTVRVVRITVQPSAAPNASPLVSAGSDRSVTLPTTTVTPSGHSAIDPEGALVSTVWTVVSGVGATISGATTMNPTFTVPTAGSYIFRLTATDAVGASASDDVRVTVGASTPATISVTSCAIALNQTTCDARTTWNLSIGTTPHLVRSVTTGDVLGTASSGANVLTRMQYGVNEVRGSATGITDVVATRNILCAAGLFYNSNLVPAVCKQLPVITITSNDTLIRSGEQAPVSFTVTADYQVRCTLSGGVPPGTSVVHNGNPLLQTSTHSGIMTIPLLAAQVVTVTCEAAGTPSIPASRVTAETTINVVPVYEEI